MFSIRGVLLAGRFRTFVQLAAMSPKDCRNTLIVELHKHTSQQKSHFQAIRDDAELAKTGAVMVFLRHTGTRPDDVLSTLTDAQQRAVMVEMVSAATHISPAELGARDTTELFRLALGAEESFLRGVLLAGKFRSFAELAAMSHDDRRRTLIVELDQHTAQKQDGGHFQVMDDASLAGTGAILAFLRHTGGRTDNELRTLRNEQQLDLMIAAMQAQTQKPLPTLRALSKMELIQLALGPESAEKSPEDPGTRPFKLKLSRPGVDIGGEWLGRFDDPYDWYCLTRGRPRVFTWYHHRDGKAYLQDQDGNWLSHTRVGNWLYMSYWPNAVAWRIEGGRLIRESDNAVLTWPDREGHLLKNRYYVSAEPPSEKALTVEVVEEELTSAHSLFDQMTAVYSERHEGEGHWDVERFRFCAAGKVLLLPVHERQDYRDQDVPFVALKHRVATAKTVPVYLLRMWSESEQRSFYKLSLQTKEGLYSLDPLGDGSPNFHAFALEQTNPFTSRVYEHASELPTPGEKRYFYDTEPNGYDGWGPGVPLFRAISAAEAEKELLESLRSQEAKQYATDWVLEHGKTLAGLLQGLGKDDVNNQGVAQELQRLFEPETKYMTLGGGFHGGYGLGMTGFEGGSIWLKDDFGHVPMREPLSDYTLEWATFGAGSGFDIGASADALVIGTWFGDLDQIEGACNGITVSGSLGAGITVTVLWDGTWNGANGTSHPIGVTAIVSIGLEMGVGVFYNASATQFINRRPSFPKT